MDKIAYGGNAVQSNIKYGGSRENERKGNTDKKQEKQVVKGDIK